MADGGLEMQLRRSTGAGGVSSGADEHSEAGLLEYGWVVVVGVAHRPAAGVPRRVAARLVEVRAHTATVRQQLERVVFARLQLTTTVQLA